ncbi:pentapeptide repeat-containing protein [Micromonospora sp. NPDC047812]|uniref:pentapeptide repeat-containing protein n=1 Tax=Micromonospora sp. NPDC047812 TaxID=3155742 RepID=UPI003455EA92
MRPTPPREEPLRVMPWWLVVVGLLLAALLGWLVLDWLLGEADRAAQPDTRATLRIDAIRTGLTVVAGTGGGLALLLAARRQWISERAQRHQEAVAAQDQAHRERVQAHAEAARFADMALFRWTEFGDQTWFEGARFEGAANFGRARFLGPVTFDGATFARRPLVDQARATAAGPHVWPEGTAVAPLDDDWLLLTDP